MQLKDLSINTDLHIDLYHYTNYKPFLQEYIDQCQQVSHRYSYRHFAKRLGVASGAYMRWIIDGKRGVSNRVLNRLIEMLGLTPTQQNYFELLVRAEKVESGSTLHQEYQKQLQASHREVMESKTLAEAEAHCIASWLHWVIREMTLLKGANFNVQWFQKCLSDYFSIPTGKLLQSIEDLKQAQLLVEEDYELKPTEASLDFSRTPQLAQLLKHYQKEAIEHSVAGLQAPSQQRHYEALLIPTTPEKFTRFKEKLEAFSNEALELLETDPGEATLLSSLSMQFFPVASVREES